MLVRDSLDLSLARECGSGDLRGIKRKLACFLVAILDANLVLQLREYGHRDNY